ncbi:hypothetical protein EDC04DRAFT_2611534 [Pisolithus marmoratus]|nr:hypothetical protein EDC04DRAFT_2611534 [Pisolithus marmoratus]
MPDNDKVPAPPSPHRTWPSNATAKPGLPDKLTPWRTPAQKQADEQHVQQVKEAKKASNEKAYQHLGNLEEEMVASQAAAKSGQVPMWPKPHPVVNKNRSPLTREGAFYLGLGDLQDKMTVVPATAKALQVTRTSKHARGRSADQGDNMRLWDAINKDTELMCKGISGHPDEVVFDDKKALLAGWVKNWVSIVNASTTSTSCHSNPPIPPLNHSSKDALDLDILNEEDNSQEHGYAIQHGTWIRQASDVEELNIAIGTEEAMACKTPYAIQHGTQIIPAFDVDGYDKSNIATAVEETMACKTPGLKWKHVAEDEGDITSDLELDTEMEDVEDVMMEGSHVTAQTALMVIEPTLIKTKAKRVAHLKSHSISAGVFSKATKLDLPPLLCNDCNHKFTKNILPSLLLWYGDEANIWSISKENLVHVLKAIIWVVDPMFDKFDEIHHGMAIYGLTIKWLTHWQHNFASTVIVLVLDFFKENPNLGVETFCNILLEKQAFTYEDLDTSDSAKPFCSSLVLKLLSTAHLQQVDGWVDIPALNLADKHAYGIRGVLAMSTSALKHAIKIIHEYAINGEETITDQLASICKKGKAAVKAPHLLSKVLGKESSATTQFSQLNWGGKTSPYLTSISNQDADTLQETVSVTCEMWASNEPLANKANAVQGSLDPHALMTLAGAASFICYSDALLVLTLSSSQGCFLPSLKSSCFLSIPHLNYWYSISELNFKKQ